MRSPILVTSHYVRTAAMATTSVVGDSPLFLVDYLLRFARVAVLLSLWRIILADKGPVSGMTLSAVLTYTLISEIFAEQLACRANMEMTLWEGTIAVRSLQPMSLVGQLAAEMAGRWLLGLILVSAPLLLSAGLWGVDARPATAAAGALFVLSMALSISVGLALEMLFGALVVALQESIWLVQQLRNAITTVLSGALLPLALLPWGLGGVFAWLPFASQASAPLRIYTNTGDAAQLLAIQAGWSLLLWPMAHWFWQANREKLTAYGG